MSEKELKLQMIERVKELESRFEKRYESLLRKFDGKKCFYVDSTEIFCVTALFCFGGIVIEHASSLWEAERNMFEDGDLFYLDELDEDAMFEAMIREIEDSTVL